MTSITHTTLDGAALRRAFSNRDGAALTALYADDATIEVADAVNTPSAPHPDGLRVLCVATAEVSGGLIVRQLTAQAWD